MLSQLSCEARAKDDGLLFGLGPDTHEITFMFAASKFTVISFLQALDAVSKKKVSQNMKVIEDILHMIPPVDIHIN